VVTQVMLKRVVERIPMPELMHEVVESLMPHMIDDDVPLVAQPMIDYSWSGNSKGVSR
jgi:hypothetical protein